MGRGRGFSPIEVDILVANFDKTIAELEALLAAEGYNRSRKSINRKLEKLRDTGVVGFRSKDTIKRSYRQRTRRNKRLAPTQLGDGMSFDSGDGAFDSGDGGFDNGDGDWGTDADWDDED